MIFHNVSNDRGVKMKRKMISMLLAVPLMGLTLGACSQEAADAPAASDTAVHDAEVAVEEVGPVVRGLK